MCMHPGTLVLSLSWEVRRKMALVRVVEETPLLMDS